MILFFPKSLQHNNLHSPDNFRYMPILFAPLFRNLYNKSCRFEKMYSFHDRFPRGDTPPARSSLFHNIKRYGGCQYILEMFRESSNNKFRKKEKGKKQILIYHTHGASEEFVDSKKNDVNDSVVGVGTELTKELEKRGYSVYHDTTRYDSINGGIDRSLAYNKSLEGVQNIRKKNPGIKVLIDLHRDSVGKGKHTYTTIQGKKTAIVMFFNGMSRTKSGAIPYLYNPNLQGNLAFSLQMKCTAMEYYEGFTKPIYLKGYRYNLHLEPRSLLIELGNENNTVEEAKNAAAPLADVLDKVLSR